MLPGWELVNGKCRSEQNILPPLSKQLICHDYSDESSSEVERSECGQSTYSDEAQQSSMKIFNQCKFANLG